MSEPMRDAEPRVGESTPPGAPSAALAADPAPPGHRPPSPDLSHAPEPARLIHRLNGVRRALRWVSRGERTGSAAWPLPLAAIVLLVVDASRPLPPPVRLALAIALGVLALRVLIGLIPSRAARRASLEHAARLAEERSGLDGNPIVNALQLRPLAAGEGLAARLASRAVACGEAAAADADRPGTRIVSTRSVVRAWTFAGLAFAAFAAFTLALPRVVSMTAARYLDPLGDHPPYSPTRFDLSVEPAEPLAGDDVRLCAALSGPIPSTLELVIVDDRGGERDRLPMTLVPHAGAAPPPQTARFDAVLHHLGDPVKVFVRGETGRSSAIAIVPQPRPRILDATLTITPPAYARRSPFTLRREALDAPGAAPTPVLIGSHLELRATCSTTLSHAGASPSDAEALVRDNTARVRVTAAAVGELALGITPHGSTGLESREAIRAVVLAEADRAPEVRVIRPARPGAELYALAGADVPVIASAMDDVGLSLVEAKVTRLRAPARVPPASADRAAPTVLPLDSREGPFTPGMTVYTGAAIIRTSELDARPGDAVELTLVARDNRGADFGGPSETVAAPIRILVLDEEEFRRRFARELDAAAVAQPYLDLVAGAKLLEEEAEALAADARRLGADAGPRGPTTADHFERARGLRERRSSLRRERDALMQKIARRLDLPPAVGFDEQMIAPLERLSDRLRGIGAGSVAEIGHEPAERDADLAATAAIEAEHDMARPARELASADALQQLVEQLKAVIARQRGLCDRLQGAEQADEASRKELASLQDGLRARLDKLTKDLAAQGARAAQELPAGPEPKTLAQRLTDQRAAAQAALDRVLAASRALADDATGKGARAAAAAAADLGMTSLYGSISAIAEALRTPDPPPASLADPGAAEHFGPVPGAVEDAIRAIESLRERLDEAERTQPDEVISRAVSRAALSVVAVASLLQVQGAPPTPAAPEPAADSTRTARDALREAIREARIRLDRLRAETIRAADRVSPLLPTMGASAIALSGRVDESGALGHMAAATELLSAGDMAAAHARAIAAAEALEALYAEARASGEKESQPPPGFDRALQLAKPPTDSHAPDEDSPAPDEATSEPNRSAPDTLQQLSQNRRAGESESENRSMQSDELSPEEGASEVQSAPARAGEPPSAGEPAGDDSRSNSAGETDAGKPAREAAARRARFFNQRLFEPDDEGERRSAKTPASGGGEAKDEHASDSDAPPADRSGAIRRAIERLGGGSAPDALAAYAHVPPAYREIVGDYFLRLAAEEARRGVTAPPAGPSAPPAESKP